MFDVGAVFCGKLWIIGVRNLSELENLECLVCCFVVNGADGSITRLRFYPFAKILAVADISFTYLSSCHVAFY